MKELLEQINKLDYGITDWMYRYGRRFLRISLGIVFIWFGLLKVYGVSPADQLITRTVLQTKPITVEYEITPYG